ncbi:MAG: DNA polymerase III subunit delta [Candidatus Saccharimonadales bacterium]
MSELPEGTKEVIISLSGTNSFAVKHRLDELTSKFKASHGDFGLERIDGEEVELPAVLEAVSNLPLLSKRKMVVLRSLGANKAAADHIEQIISSTSESCDLIFYEPTVDKRTTYFKVLKDRTQLEEHSEITGAELAKWLVDTAKNAGAELSFADANYLIERVGPNQALLAKELEKLLTYQLKISKDQIDLLTNPNPGSRIFDLLDAAFSRQKQKALKLYDEQRAQKVEPQAILALIAWQLSLLAYVKYGEGRTASEIAQNSGGSPYPITKAQRLAAKITVPQLKNIVSEALEIDKQAKTSPIDLDEALKNYITAL